MLRKVRLYGQLAEFVGRKVIEADLSSAAEAVRMLIANFPGLDGRWQTVTTKCLWVCCVDGR